MFCSSFLQLHFVVGCEELNADELYHAFEGTLKLNTEVLPPIIDAKLLNATRRLILDQSLEDFEMSKDITLVLEKIHPSTS